MGSRKILQSIDKAVGDCYESCGNHVKKESPKNTQCTEKWACSLNANDLQGTLLMCHNHQPSIHRGSESPTPKHKRFQATLVCVCHRLTAIRQMCALTVYYASSIRVFLIDNGIEGCIKYGYMSFYNNTGNWRDAVNMYLARSLEI